MEKDTTTELVSDKESGCLILGKKTERKVKKIHTFLGWKEGKKSYLEWTEAKNKILAPGHNLVLGRTSSIGFRKEFP